MSGAAASLVDPRAAAAATAGLCAAFAVKHYLADFIVQTNWMARGKERAAGWFIPLLAHTACHAGLALVLTLAVAPSLWWLAIVDFGVHFTIDRAKSVAAQWGGWKPDEAQFWWLLGLDQLLHQLTNIGLALAVMVL